MHDYRLAVFSFALPLAAGQAGAQEDDLESAVITPHRPAPTPTAGSDRRNAS